MIVPRTPSPQWLTNQGGRHPLHRVTMPSHLSGEGAVIASIPTGRRNKPEAGRGQSDGLAFLMRASPKCRTAGSEQPGEGLIDGSFPERRLAMWLLSQLIKLSQTSAVNPRRPVGSRPGA